LLLSKERKSMLLPAPKGLAASHAIGAERF
jgi:hypothetical protein